MQRNNVTNLVPELWPQLPKPNWTLIVLSSISCLTVSGNFLVCIAIFVDKRLQNMTNYFLLSLAFADLGVAVFVMPLALTVAIKGYWPFGPLLCNIFLHVDILLCTASILHLCTISLDRYLAIKHPLHYKMMGRTIFRILLKILFVWVLATAIALPGFLLGWHDKKRIISNQWCGYFATSKSFIVYSAAGSFFIPLIAMIALYSASVYVLQKSEKITKQSYANGHMSFGKTASIRFTRPSSSMGSNSELKTIKRRNTTNAIAVHRPTAKKQARRTRSGEISRKVKSRNSSQNKAMKVLGIVFLCFFICWFPFFCAYYWQGLGFGQLSPTVNLCFQWLGYFNSGINPIIYSAFNKTFRNAFSKILRCRLLELRRKPVLNPLYNSQFSIHKRETSQRISSHRENHSAINVQITRNVRQKSSEYPNHLKC